MKMVSVRDIAMNAFMNPWFTPTTATAVRAFQNETQNPESPMAKNPEDYELWELGSFDETTGLVSDNSPKRIARAIDFKEQK